MSANRQHLRASEHVRAGAGLVESGTKNGPGIAELDTLAGASPNASKGVRLMRIILPSTTPAQVRDVRPAGGA